MDDPASRKVPPVVGSLVLSGATHPCRQSDRLGPLDPTGPIPSRSSPANPNKKRCNWPARRARASRRLRARRSSSDSPPQTPISWPDSIAHFMQESTTSHRRHTAFASATLDKREVSIPWAERSLCDDRRGVCSPAASGVLRRYSLCALGRRSHLWRPDGSPARPGEPGG
jgi:hypothetical protein